MRKIFIAIYILGIFSVKGQTPIREISKQEWKIIPAIPNTNAFGKGYMGLENYADARAEVSPSEQAFLVNFERKEYGVILVNEELKVKWQTPIPGILHALYKVNDKLIVIHKGSNELRNEAYLEVSATVLDPKSGKIIMTKNLLGGKPDHYVDVHTFQDPDNKELIIGIRHTPEFLKQKSKMAVSFSSSDYPSTSKYEVVYFDENLEQKNKILLPIRKSGLWEVKMNIDKNFVITYDQAVGVFGLQVISGTNEVWYKTFTVSDKARVQHIVDVVPSTLHSNVFFFSARYYNNENEPVLSFYRIDYKTNEVTKFERVLSKAYRKELIPKWVAAEEDNKTRPIPESWENFKFSSIIETPDKVILIAESTYSETYMYNSPSASGQGFQTRSSMHYENSDMLLTVFDNNLGILDEKLVGKNYKHSSTTNHFAGVKLKDNLLYIITASDEKARMSRPLIMKYNISSKSMDVQPRPDKVQRNGVPRTSPSSTIWFDKGYAIVFWDSEQTYFSSNAKSDLQYFKY